MVSLVADSFEQMLGSPWVAEKAGTTRGATMEQLVSRGQIAPLEGTEWKLARMAESVYAIASKAIVRKDMRVRVPLRALRTLVR